MDPSCPTPEVGYWSGGVRVGRRRLSSGRAPTPARRSGQVSFRRDLSNGQVSSVVDFAIPSPHRGAGAFLVSVVGHSYMVTLLPLWLTMSLTPVILAVRRASVGADPTEQELGNLIVQELIRPSRSSGIDPTEQGLENWAWDFAVRVNLGTNPGDLAERVNSGADPGDLGREGEFERRS
ncbi:hypothetical protein B296_00044705 [Ensete ventricosum]|uniref:Uncharacterized protein n=1 Tax=Ensete ventricosum TaxID=4639 RepID=A0A426XB12_ENSVE|nr:hypothetical protein B296_00044705 [Ensete ventricosum]